MPNHFDQKPFSFFIMETEPLILSCGNPLCKVKVRITNPSPLLTEFNCPKCNFRNIIESKTIVDNPSNSLPLPEVVGWLINSAGHRYSLKLGINLIGRNDKSNICDVILNTDDNSISRKHCTIDVSIGSSGYFKYLIYDGVIIENEGYQKSKNGTIVNKNERLNSYEKRIYLEDKSTILIGKTRLNLETVVLSEEIKSFYSSGSLGGTIVENK